MREASEFWSMVQKTPGCWVWKACTDPKGYGMVRFRGRMRRAHRLAYELHNGPVPEGLHVCHACDYPSCVNPSHLWVGTNADNTRDREAKGRNGRANARKTHCKHGHEFTAENTMIRPNGSRKCRVCDRALGKLWRSRKRVAQ